jgi:hypothetical protein
VLDSDLTIGSLGSVARDFGSAGLALIHETPGSGWTTTQWSSPGTGSTPPQLEEHAMTSTPTVPTNSTAPTGVVFGATPGMPRVFTSNFDYQFVRAMCAGSYGDGGAVGECFSTARRVVDGDIESWTVAWSDTAQ